MKIRVFAAMVCLIMSTSIYAQRHNTIRKGLKAGKTVVAPSHTVALCDTVAATGSEVRFSGYEKTLRSTRETVFVTNLSDRQIERVIFSVTYIDAKGRQLHKTRKSIHSDIPAGETRRLDFPTWDRQFAFYYVGSPRPRVSAIPYSVKIIPDSLVYVR